MLSSHMWPPHHWRGSLTSGRMTKSMKGASIFSRISGSSVPDPACRTSKYFTPALNSDMARDSFCGPGAERSSSSIPNRFSKVSLNFCRSTLVGGPPTTTLPSFLAASTILLHSPGASAARAGSGHTPMASASHSKHCCHRCLRIMGLLPYRRNELADEYSASPVLCGFVAVLRVQKLEDVVRDLHVVRRHSGRQSRTGQAKASGLLD